MNIGGFISIIAIMHQKVLTFFNKKIIILHNTYAIHILNFMTKNNLIYKDIPGYEGFYKVSNFGNVFSYGGERKFGKITYTFPAKELKPTFCRGYPIVNLSKNSKIKRFGVHQLVLLAFVGQKPFKGAETRHLDGNPSNNKLENLVYGTKSENMQDAVKHGTLVFSRSNLTREDVIKIAQDTRKVGDIAKSYKTNSTTVINIKSKKSFKNFTNETYYKPRTIKKLSYNDLKEIRDKNNPRKNIAKKFNLTIFQIKRIRKGFDTIFVN